MPSMQPIFLSLARLGLASLLCLSSTGCALLQKEKAPPPQPASRSELIDGYKLLYDLVSQEKDVPKLLIIKNETPPLRAFIKEIGRTASLVQKELEQLKPRLKDSADPLPLAERQTRKAIEKTRTRELLRSRGADFELRLVLSQLEALTYAVHLAQSLAAAESSPARRKMLTEFEQAFLDLYAQGLKLVSRKP